MFRKVFFQNNNKIKYNFLYPVNIYEVCRLVILKLIFQLEMEVEGSEQPTTQI